MNKTVNINLGGLFFHIDENAYKTLKNYLKSIALSLSDDAQGKDEIIKDIELRIGELLLEKITKERQVVDEENIQDIISIMGQPEEYEGEEDEGYKTWLQNKSFIIRNKDIENVKRKNMSWSL